MTKEVQVLYVSRYDFKVEDTGEILKGCKVTYAEVVSSKGDDFVGYKVNTSNFPYDVYDRFTNAKFPAKAQICFDFVDMNKKPKVKDIVLI